jgi:hypothetical protein
LHEAGLADERPEGSPNCDSGFSSGENTIMPNQTQTEYKIPTTREQYRFLCGILLPQIQDVFGVDRDTAHKRMREKLIEWGYIRKSRSELSYFQTIDITERFKKFLAKQSQGEVVDPLSANDLKHYAESGIHKTL